MTDEPGSYTLPEITIVGDPTGAYRDADTYYCDGFEYGWANPEAAQEAPAPLREDLLTAYFLGMEAGQRCRRVMEEQYDGPAIGPDLGGEPYEELERQWQEAWGEFLNHRHEPHTEIEGEVVPPPPLPNITFVIP